MAEAVDYVRPIIDAMVHHATLLHASKQLDQQKVRDAEEQRAHQAEEKLRTDALSQAMDIANQQHEYQQQQIDLQHQQRQLQQDQFHQANVHQMRADVASGLIKPLNNVAGPTEAPSGDTYGVQQPANSTQVGDTSEFINNSSFQTPEDILKQVEAHARAQGKGQFEGLKDPLQAEHDAAQAARDATKQKAEAEEKKLDRENRLQVARITAAKSGVDPDLIESLGEQVATGQADLSGTTKASLAARDYLTKTGQKPFTKKQSDALKGSAAINNFFDDIKAFADKLPESKIGAMANSALQASPIPTDLKNDLDILKQNAVNVGKSIEGLSGGRITNLQLSTMIKGMASTGKTKQQVIDDAEALRKKFLQGVNTSILGGYSPAQRAKILDVHGIDEKGISGGISSTAPKKIVYTRDASGKLVQQ